MIVGRVLQDRSKTETKPKLLINSLKIYIIIQGFSEIVSALLVV